MIARSFLLVCSSCFIFNVLCLAKVEWQRVDQSGVQLPESGGERLLRPRVRGRERQAVLARSVQSHPASGEAQRQDHILRQVLRARSGPARGGLHPLPVRSSDQARSRRGPPHLQRHDLVSTRQLHHPG